MFSLGGYKSGWSWLSREAGEFPFEEVLETWLVLVLLVCLLETGDWSGRLAGDPSL